MKKWKLASILGLGAAALRFLLDFDDFGVFTFFFLFVVSTLAIRLTILLQDQEAKNQDDIASTKSPLRLAFQNKSTVATWFLLSTCTVLYLFPGVFTESQTIVSAPDWGLREVTSATGHGRLQDPWAGLLLEAPGFFMTSEAFRQGEIPLWNHHASSGSPFAADGEMAVFSVLQFPLNYFPSMKHWDYFSLFRLALAMAAAALCARGLGFRWQGCWLISFGFAASGLPVRFSNLVHMNTYIFVPFIILGFIAHLSGPSKKTLFFLALTSAFAFNGGNPQPLVSSLLVLVPFSLYALMMNSGTWRERITPFIGLGAALILGFLTNAIALLPMMDLLSHSANRNEFPLGNASRWHKISSFIVPKGLDGEGFKSWYLGWIFLALVIGGVIVLILDRKKRNQTTAQERDPTQTPKAIRFSQKAIITTLGLGSFLYLSITFYQPFYTLAQKSPLISRLEWTKYIGAVLFSLSLFAAFALENFTGRFRKKGLMLGGVILVALVLELSYYHHPLGEEFPWTPETFATEPALAALKEAQDNEDDKLWRSTAINFVAPPLLNSSAGFLDFRSLQALPLKNYHRLCATSANGGIHPPYMINGTTRRFFLSPLLDLLGIRYFLVDQMTDSLFRSPPKNPRRLEDQPELRWGELKNAVNLKSTTGHGVIRFDAETASMYLDGDADLTFQVRPNAAQTNLEFSARRVEDIDQNFQVDITVDGTQGTINKQNPEAQFAIGNKPKVEFIVRVTADSPIVLTVEEWDAERFLPKGRADWKLARPPVDTPEGTALIVLNQQALPLARLSKQPEFLSEEEFWPRWEEFVATGKGWDNWRQGLLISGASAAEKSLVTNEAGEELSAPDLQLHSDNRMTATFKTNAPTWLSLTVCNDGHWRAFDGDQEIPIRNGNGAFMAVPIHSAGDHQIEFRYEPAPFIWGRRISILGLLVIMVLGVMAVRQERVVKALNSN